MGQTSCTAHQDSKLQKCFSSPITGLFPLSVLTVYLHKWLDTGKSEIGSHSYLKFQNHIGHGVKHMIGFVISV